MALLVALIILLTPAMTGSALAFLLPLPPGQSQTIPIANRDAAFALACHSAGGFFGDVDCTSASDPPVTDLFSNRPPTGREVIAQNGSAVAKASAARFGNASAAVGAPDGAVFVRSRDRFDAAEGRVLLNYIVTDRSGTLGGDGLIAVRVAGAASAAVGGRSEFRVSVYQEPIFFSHNEVTYNFVTGDIQQISAGPCGGTIENLASLLCVTGQHDHTIPLDRPNDPNNAKQVIIAGRGAFSGPPTVNFEIRSEVAEINQEFVVGVRAGTPFTVDLDARTNPGPAFAGVDPIVRPDPRNPDLIVQRLQLPAISGSLTSLLTDEDLSELTGLGINVDTSIFSFAPPDQTAVPEPATMILIGSVGLISLGVHALGLRWRG